MNNLLRWIFTILKRYCFGACLPIFYSKIIINRAQCRWSCNGYLAGFILTVFPTCLLIYWCLIGDWRRGFIWTKSHKLGWLKWLDWLDRLDWLDWLDRLIDWTGWTGWLTVLAGLAELDWLDWLDLQGWCGWCGWQGYKADKADRADRVDKAERTDRAD